MGKKASTRDMDCVTHLFTNMLLRFKKIIALADYPAGAIILR